MKQYWAILIVLLCLKPFSTLAQSSFVPGNYAVRNYSPEEYGGYFQNWNAVQDQKGLMYFANNTKVLEFDGKSWRTFVVNNGAKVLSLAVDKQGVVYVGGIGEIGYLSVDSTGKKQYQSLISLIPEEHRVFQNIWRVVATDEGVFFKEREKIFHYHDGKVDVIPAPVHPFFYGIGNDIFVTDSAGVKVLINGSFELLPQTEKLNSKDHSLVHVLPSKNGKLLLMSRWHGIYQYDYQKLLTLKGNAQSLKNVDVPLDILRRIPSEIDDYTAKYQIYDACRINDNRYAIATLGGGILIIDGNAQLVSLINKDRGLVDDRIYHLLPDQSGNVWAATNNGLAYIHTNSPFTYFNSSHGLNTGVLNTIRHNGVLYTSTYNALYSLPPYQLTVNPQKHELHTILDAPAWALHSYKGLLFAGTTQNLYQVIGNTSKKLLDIGDVIYGIGHSDKIPNHLILGTRKGIIAVELTMPSSPNGWASAKQVPVGALNQKPYIIKEINQDWQQNLWLSTENNGILYLEFPSEKIEDCRIVQLDTTFGLAYNTGNLAYTYGTSNFITSNNKIIHEIKAKSGENLIADTASLTLATSPIQSYIPENYAAIEHIDFGANGDMYLSSNKGLALMQADGKGGYTWEDMPFKEIQSNVWKKYIDENGIAWFNSNNSLIRYDRNISKEYTSSYNALIRKVYINVDSTIFYGNEVSEQPYSTEHPHRSLKYEEHNIKFEYSAAFYEQEEQMEYQYFLDGFDKGPSAWTKETQKEYTNLPEGQYCFRVKGRNVFGHESETASYYFTIQTPWHRSYAAYIAYAILSAALVYIIVKINTKRLERDKEKLERIVDQRTTEIVTQNEELQQQAEEIMSQRDHIQTQNKNLLEANLAIQEQKEQVEKAYHNINVLSNIGRNITTALRVDTIVGIVYRHVNELMPAEAFGIGVYNEASQTIDFEGFIEHGEALPFNSDSIADKNALSVYCFLNQKEVIINDFALEHTQYVESVGGAVAGGIPSSIIYMPLILENKAIGVITVQSFEKNVYTEADIKVLSTLTSYAAIAVANANSYEIIEEKNEHITSSIRYAQTIQQAVLPNAVELHQAFDDYFLIYRPKDIVSGDFYWSTEVKGPKGQKRRIVAVADCTGHGVPGAFMSMLGTAFLNEIIAIKGIIEPADILKELDKSIREALHQEDKENNDGMDVSLCCLESQGQDQTALYFAGAKQYLLWFEQATGILHKIKGSNRSIGGFIRNSKVFEQEHILLKKGDRLYMQTDGLADQADGNRHKIGSQQVQKTIEAYATSDLNDQKGALIQLLESTQGATAQRDDITVLGLKV